MLTKNEKKKLISEAKRARRFAYAPYSRFKVGAALLTSGGKIFRGCNVENSSYGLTICAERAAIFKAVSGGKTKFKALAVTASSKTPASPCGACRQVLLEFGEDIEVLMVSGRGDWISYELSKLLPLAFRLIIFFFLLAPSFSIVIPLHASSSTEKLIKDLKSPDSSKQARAMQKLHLLRFKDISDAMERYADDPNPDMRILMSQTLGEMGGAEAVRSLTRLFQKEKDARVRKALLIQIAGLSPDEKVSIDFFGKVAGSDKDDELRYLALNQLSLLGQSQAAKKKLEKIFWKVWKHDPNENSRVFSSVLLRELGNENKELNEGIYLALKNPSVEVRRRSALAAGTLREEQTVSRISDASRDADGEVRANLCRAFSQIGNSDSIPVLRILSQDKEPSVRKSALDALSQFPSSDVGIKDFLAALGDKEPSVRTLAVSILEKSADSDAIKPLENLSGEDPDPQIRLLAKKAAATIVSQCGCYANTK